MLSLPPKFKILSILAKSSWKMKIKLFPECAMYFIWKFSNILFMVVVLNTHGGVILTLSFPDNISFWKNHFFNWIPFLYPLFLWKLTLSKTIEYLSMSLVAHKEGCSSLFHLFEFVSGTLQPFPACYGLSRVVPLFTRDDVTECFD